MNNFNKETFKNEKNVDVTKLRPDGSYDILFQDRDYVIKKIIADNNGTIPEDWLIKRACQLCQNNSFSFYLSKDFFTLVKCLNCNLIYVNPTLEESKYIEIYQQQNYGHILENLTLKSHDYRRIRFGEERMDLISKFSSLKSGKILDIGAGSGFLIEEAISRGWDGIGLELSKPACEFAVNRGIPIVSCTLDEMDFKEDEFDVVTAFDVLEHIFEPRKFVRNIKRILKPYGTLMIYVPNMESASFHLMGDKAHFIWPTHHLTYFTPETISKFMKILDFEVLHVETKGLDIEDYIWQRKNLHGKNTEELNLIKSELQFYINEANFGKNLRIILKNLK
jgi:2-polyprenyl-3-methyl-5-hydroxy-6-metoxy-1,4-benzoquinol methylase